MIDGRLRLAVLAIGLCAMAAQPAGQNQDPSVASLLERYAGGQQADAVAAAAAIPNLTLFRARYPLDAPVWIGTGADAPRRRRAAATFVLELTRARLESDWRLLRDLVEWTCADLRAAGPVDPFEDAWHLAALSLSGRARDRIWLLGEVPYLPGQKPARAPAPVVSAAHLLHVAERLAGSSAIRLEWLVAWTWGRDREPTRNVEAGRIPMIPARRERQLEVLAALRGLAGDPAVGPHAALRAAHLQFVLGDYPGAHATASAIPAASPDIQYVANVIAGRALEEMKNAGAARQAYERALVAVPGGESASLALAAILFTSDDRSGASTLVDRALVRTRDGDDPWRLFLYGSYRQWPARLRVLRTELAR